MNAAEQMAIREALNDADGAAGSPDDLLTLQARAVIDTMARLGYIRPAGHEHRIRRGDITEAIGFNTEDQARRWGDNHLDGTYIIERRPVGVWEGI